MPRGFTKVSALFVLLCAISCFGGGIDSCLAQSSTSASELANQFRKATESFGNRNFSEARTGFLQVAQEAPGTELAIQCEYFAALSAWNSTPNQVSAIEVRDWLHHAKQFEENARAKQTRITSSAWDKWIEAAHLILVKWDLQHGKDQAAQARLRILSRTDSKPEPNGEETLTGREQMAWPERSDCSSHVWLELGIQLAKKSTTQDEAKDCFERAIATSSNDPAIASLAAWHAATVCMSQSHWDEAITYAANLEQQSSSVELRMRGALLECEALDRSGRPVDFRSKLEPLVNIAKHGNVPAQILVDLGSALATRGLSKESQEVFETLLTKYPSAAANLETHVRIARSAAERNDWDTVVSHTQKAVELESDTPWKAYAYYLLGRGLHRSDQREDGIASLEKGLKECRPPRDLEIVMQLELVEMLYRAEAWDRMLPHITSLQRFASESNDSPVWLPTVQLRRAEYLASKSKWSETESIISEIQANFPEWSKGAETDYLLARCYIAKTDFDAARTLLESIANNPQDSTSRALAARATWMAGETFMMQRRYLEAVESYKKVFAIPNEPYWYAACAVQIGQCAELCQDTEAAIEWYRKVSDKFADYPFAKTADERLAQLTSSSLLQAERIGSGKKR